MAAAGASAPTADAALATAKLHAVLRFAGGTTGAFVLAEAMGWYPTFLPALFAAMLLANLPGPLPGKAGIALLVVQLCGAYAAFAIASLLIESPLVLFGIVAIVLFSGFAKLARGGGMLPILLVMIAFATVPIITLTAPQQASLLALAFTRSMAVAVCVVWVVHVVWPARPDVKPPAPAAQLDRPIARAALSTLIVLPLMLVYLMFGITDALPVLITTVVLVTTFDPGQGASQGIAMMLANLIGGMVAVVAVTLLQLAPNLGTLALTAFLVGCLFAVRIGRGGPGGAVAVVTYNQAMVMFSLALVPGGADTGLWMSRLLQFGIASLFAVGMLSLLMVRRPDKDQLAGPA